MFREQRIDEFIETLASKDPVPGGGSGAALSAALGAALVSMVCNLTLGKKGYEQAQEPLAAVLARSEVLRSEALVLLERDTQAYAKVMTAYRLPRKTPEQQAEREEALQAALREAIEAPLLLADRCDEIVRLALPAAQWGNRWAVSDAGVGALLAEASLHAALLNVRINLASITDAAYAAGITERIERLEQDAPLIKDQVMMLVRLKIGS